MNLVGEITTYVVDFGGSMDERARGWEWGALMVVVLLRCWEGEDRHREEACRLAELNRHISYGSLANNTR